MFELQNWIRPRVLKMKPYSSARDEFAGKAEVYLDANENPFDSIPHQQPYNRYPDPMQRVLKHKIGDILGIKAETIFLGNGSDEAIDLLIRMGCEPNQDEILIMPPTYGMYAVSAEINSIDIKEVPLLPDFQIDVNAVLEKIQPNTKIIFLCSPNNPTGNSLAESDILKILKHFQGVVVIDEAYADFSNQPSWAGKLQDFPNLVILRTFSKAWGMAAVRLGMAIASEALIQFFNKVKSPYNINILTQEYALEALSHYAEVQGKIQILNHERDALREALMSLPTVQCVYPSDANFLLVKIAQADKVYQYLLQKGIVVRNRSKIIHCEDCLRITVGTPKENQILISALQKLS